MQLRSGLKAQVHAVMAKEGVLPEHQDLFRSIGGRRQLDELILSDSYLVRLESLRDLIELYDREVGMLDRKIHGQLKDDPRYRVIQQLNGIGPVIAAILIAEIGDVTRFRSPEALCSWAGLTPRHFESDLTVHRGPITKMGSPLVRWAIQEGIARYKGDTRLRSHRRAARQAQGPHRRGPQTAHARLLRPARRRDPRARPDSVSIPAANWTRTRLTPSTPAPRPREAAQPGS